MFIGVSAPLRAVYSEVRIIEIIVRGTTVEYPFKRFKFSWHLVEKLDGINWNMIIPFSYKSSYKEWIW